MKFKESPLVKNHKILTGTKRDMRKKVVKSTTPTSDLKKPTTLKRQLGGNIFTTYNSITPYEGPVFEQPVATVEIEELPINRLEANRQNVMAKAEEKKEEPVVEEKVNTEPLPTSKEETPIVESKESTPINIKSKDEFIKTMTPAFENALKAKGLDTKYAKYLVAQSALESNWGKSQSGKFNFGGIKGKGTIRKTREVINGKSIHINDSFRDFKDINDYANYHVSLLNNKRYQAFSGGDFIDRVVKGGYATDPNYKRALSNVYNQIAKAQEGMKIPKLKGAGELRNRILRQFNREKAADRNEEQLIGFDWSRYKSNKPKPETTPTQSEQLENGGVIKAKDGWLSEKIEKLKSFPSPSTIIPDEVKNIAIKAAPTFVTLLTGNPILGNLFNSNEGKPVAGGKESVTNDSFRQKSKTYYEKNIKPNHTFENVYATELNDSIQSNPIILDNLGKYPSKLNQFNKDGNYISLAGHGVYKFSGPRKNLGNTTTKPYFDGFNKVADIASQIRQIGKKKGLSDNQIATLIESGWRESNLNYTKDSSGAYGLWQFDKPAGTYDRYKKWLKANGLKDNLESQLNYTVDEYMPSRDYEGKDKNGNIIRRKGYEEVWNNPSAPVDSLAKYFLTEVEAPAAKNEKWLQQRSMNAAKTLVGRK